MYCIFKYSNFIFFAFIFFIVSIQVNCNSNIELNETKKYLTRTDGKASYYAHRFHNKKTASGEKYDMYSFTAAHKKLPFGTIVKITNQDNDKSVLVKINDRGPFRCSRILDLSYRAAKLIDGLHTPEIAMDYFDFSELENDLDNDNFIGYSLSKDFVVFNKSDINFVDSSEDFEEISNSFYQYEQIEGTSYYLFTEAKKPTKNMTYYIGSISSNIAERK